MQAVPLRRHWVLSCLLLLAGCGGAKTVTMDDYRTRVVTFPSGKKIRAEVMTHPLDVMRGMMFRDELAPDRGMLFIHGEPGNYPYWMYQVRIPLDIIWMGASRSIVEISANTPPCPSKNSSECPKYGGNQKALFVLELGGGMAARYGLRLGDTISF
jgi:hypothetical protein